ncbi:hypothetical protein P175DRAFT_0504790 [Aspergillus ochraceoroseus IBT 24754]|uniref:Uncharacterized protein n=1 Tax=Aspergillus ochraceoroseus IBT 24754 TaxID=1392256 RepID=A0A2T5LMK1_9EURO|nr:uncharacterized protein P175DRAFT_0504790 [Aspergillus ochraceoroseus IBT 24754]PTU17497.1 hypothetical protein P175DRAFT_0504790 [Aspergillus ochraceoroseus IBT 24754]
MSYTPMEIHPPRALPPNRPARDESSRDFLARVPPSSTKVDAIGQWISITNPSSPKIEDDVPSLLAQGTSGLRQFANETAQLTLHRDHSGATAVVTGKSIFFIRPGRVDYYWGIIAAATMRGELGFGAKVAADEWARPHSLDCGLYARLRGCGGRKAGAHEAEGAGPGNTGTEADFFPSLMRCRLVCSRAPMFFFFRWQSTL